MATIDQIKATIKDMDDVDLIARWKSNSFTESAHIIAKAELERRGIDTETPEPRVSPIETPSPKVKRSWAEVTVPTLFAIGSGGGMAVAIGGLAALIFIFPVGYAAGYLLYLKVREMQKMGAILITSVALVAWSIAWALAGQVLLHGLRSFK